MAMRNASQDLDIGFEPKNMDASILFFGQRWRLATAAGENVELGISSNHYQNSILGTQSDVWVLLDS
jgi:hypothetical protein